MNGTLVNRTALATALVLWTVSASFAQDDLTAFVHGFSSQGEAWQATAQRLQRELAIVAHTPTLDWQAPFEQQGSQLQGDLSTRTGVPLVVGHSNGGLVNRQLSRTYPLQALVTVGSPNRGAPFARNL